MKKMIVVFSLLLFANSSQAAEKSTVFLTGATFCHEGEIKYMDDFMTQCKYRNFQISKTGDSDITLTYYGKVKNVSSENKEIFRQGLKEVIELTGNKKNEECLFKTLKDMKFNTNKNSGNYMDLCHSRVLYPSFKSSAKFNNYMLSIMYQ
ncbi:hypothetical protein [Photobacterium carnosum]|jgi:hypothetical protein|uniref:hypothetical protein n=1 Tax=Photobacterium carnosum TaxID=2023717 RepID=UPI001E562D4B|nr:hypothetical protein [Photobacterium carnosum]MCD9528605.1 hypothetical protein [Photobacterium carnosum]MCD9541959.1 hypothetical protein [Photobacterium carnosum]MCD9543689.1 hypothetical protein [Photobacterium carnosum]MCF2152806.1 hypothetical protein [Photobacterium carnosum]MCF2214566.1 hypothetical protein [Photobacterium carnosum]